MMVRSAPDGSVELFLSVGLDGAVGGGVSHAGEHETGFDLVVVQEALVGLIDGASGDLAGAGGASASAAGVGQIDALLFSSVEDLLVVGHFDGLVETFALADQGDLVGSHDLVNAYRVPVGRSCRTALIYCRQGVIPQVLSLRPVRSNRRPPTDKPGLLLFRLQRR